MATSAEVLDIQSRAAPKGILRWLSTTDHKDIGILYMLAAFVFLLVGGLEALLIRIQLAIPNNTFLSPETYNQIFTMHGTTMIFLFGMPIIVGFANFLVPLMIGARDMAFPRLNALSFWAFLFGGILMYSAFLLGGAPDAGWFAYTPLSTRSYLSSHGMDFWSMGIILTGVGSIAGSINLIVTILNMRTYGMSMMKTPLFVWQILVTAVLMLFAIPSLTVDAILLFLNRNFAAPFFTTQAGTQQLLWQHLFWFFGHPEVYILILPAFGILSEVVPVFSGKPIFGYRAIVYSGIMIGFLGFAVWAHHMFAVGMSPAEDAAFSLASMVIAVPTSIKIFSWIATMWGGRLRFDTPLLYSIGFIAMFTIGGLSGVSLAIVPIDQQVTDTYYVVAHLHYVLFGGTIFGLFAGAFYWFPKISGLLLNEKLGKLQFWIMMIGFNLTFMPMHIVGLMGMPRRVYTYDPSLGWNVWNMVETIGSFMIGVAILVFIWNIFVTFRGGKLAGNDPWDGFTLEWTTSSPPPPYDFAVLPRIFGARPLYDQKHPGSGFPKDVAQQETAGLPQSGNLFRTETKQPAGAVMPADDVYQGKGHANDLAADQPVRAGQETTPAHEAVIHLPGGSYYPLLVAFGLTVAAYSFIYLPMIAPLGIVIAFTGIVLWAWQQM